MGALERIAKMREVLKGTDIDEELGQVQFILLEAIDAFVAGDTVAGYDRIGGWAPCAKCGHVSVCYLLEPICEDCKMLKAEDGGCA